MNFKKTYEWAIIQRWTTLECFVWSNCGADVKITCAIPGKVKIKINALFCVFHFCFQFVRFAGSHLLRF